MENTLDLYRAVMGNKTVRAYLECALWASTYDDGSPMDDDSTIQDLADDVLADALHDIATFEEMAADLLSEAALDSEQVGHDLWLTRNRHGAGFWDRGLPSKIGNGLTALAHSMGSYDLYEGDDGKIHGHG